jgi:hypothetical protein
MEAAASFSSFSRRPDHDVGTFFHEALGGGQANPAASACNDRNFPRQFLSVVVGHMFSPFIYSY